MAVHLVILKLSVVDLLNLYLHISSPVMCFTCPWLQCPTYLWDFRHLLQCRWGLCSCMLLRSNRYMVADISGQRISPML